MSKDDKTLTTRRREGDLHQKVSYLPDIHRLLPQSPDAERAIIGSFLLAPSEIGAFCRDKGIDAEWMHLPAHQTILGTLLQLWDAGKPIDFITLTQLLRDRTQLDAVGGAAYITELFTFLPTAANAAYYLDIVEEKVTLRKIIKVCTEYAARSYDEQDDVPGLLAGLEKDALAIRRGDEATIREANPKDAVMRAVHAIEAMYERRGTVGGLTTGFAELDKLIDGLHGQELTIIAARPSMGKTALAMNIAEHIAIEERKPVAVFSCEMSESQLFQRLICSRARVNMSRVREGFLADRDFPALTASAARLAETPLYVMESIGATYGAIAAKARRLHQRHGIAAVFVDYVQLVRSTSKQAASNREREIAEVSAGFKNLAHELKIPVILLAQLGRDVEKRSHRGGNVGWPRLSDLRESGSLEQDADNVIFIHREEMYAETDDERKESEGKATMIVAKQRNGPLGDIPLTFLKEFARFESRARGYDDEEQPAPPALPGFDG